MENEIYNRFRADLIKRSFEIEKEGMCVRREVAEKVLRNAIEHCLKITKQPKRDFWDEDL